eukprot:6183412-Pleurochrysis_carterae.AAC.4
MSRGWNRVQTSVELFNKAGHASGSLVSRDSMPKWGAPAEAGVSSGKATVTKSRTLSATTRSFNAKDMNKQWP